jgi:hypothetical protein
VLVVQREQRARPDHAGARPGFDAPLKEPPLGSRLADLLDETVRFCEARERRTAPEPRDLGIGEDREQRLGVGGNDLPQPDELSGQLGQAFREVERTPLLGLTRTRYLRRRRSSPRRRSPGC